MARTAERISTGGYDVGITNPDKVMYAGNGFTKRDVIDYYQRIAAVLLPHISNRPLTRVRFPDGTGVGSFFEKNAPRHTPEWIRTENVATPGSAKGRTSIDFVVADKPADLVWLGNQAALELHTPQWQFDGHRATNQPDRLIADLDPGPGLGVAECIVVARLLRERFAEDGLEAYVKSSGKRGLHVCCPISGTQSYEIVSAYAKNIALQLSKARPQTITANMRKAEREGRIFIDWSQNNAAKTTVAPYSLRNRSEPTVSAPVRWDELDDDRFDFAPDDVMARIEADGDLWSAVLTPGPKLPE